MSSILCPKGISGIFVVLTTIVAFANPVNSFVDHALHRNGESTCRKTQLQVSESSRGSIMDENLLGDRRAVLLSGASVATAFFLNKKISTSSPAILTTLESAVDKDTVEPTISTVSSVAEALNIIESRGDKRFLHAVVASDYQFLYEQSKTVPSDIDSEQIFSKKVPSVNNKSRAVHLATTGNLRSKKSSSLWPLGNAMTTSGSDIHYAWPEQGGLLEPNQNVAVTQKMIVDGIDCGKMSLEDALEGDMQVLVQAPTYLSVPSHMESSLRKGLQEAFLI